MKWSQTNNNFDGVQTSWMLFKWILESESFQIVDFKILFYLSIY